MTRYRGRLLVSAFDRFHTHRGWTEVATREGTGIVFDVRSGRDVMSGLSSPHNPLWIDGGWLVCNSARGELLRLDGKGAQSSGTNSTAGPAAWPATKDGST